MGRGGGGLGRRAGWLWGAAGAPPVVPAGASTPLVAVAVRLLLLMEKVAAVREHWPQAWLRGRKQHMQFLMVSLGSVGFWLISQDNQALIKAATGG